MVAGELVDHLKKAFSIFLLMGPVGWPPCLVKSELALREKMKPFFNRVKNFINELLKDIIFIQLATEQLLYPCIALFFCHIGTGEMRMRLETSKSSLCE